jgi:hypothetical protein
MKYASLIAAAAVVLLANAFALVHAARNRSGQPDAEITLTERELSYYPDPDDSGVVLTLQWVDRSALLYSASLTAEELEGMTWLNQAKLEELGFDCSVPLTDPKAESFYARQGARTAFLALEYDGPAWQSWLEWRQRMAEEQAKLTGLKTSIDDDRRSATRLAAIDTARYAAVLRARHPDRGRVLILPAIIRMSLTRGWPAGGGRAARPARLSGYIQEAPSKIHVPRPFSDRLRALRENPRRYRVQLRYGSLLEPWVISVEPEARVRPR